MMNLVKTGPTALCLILFIAGCGPKPGPPPIVPGPPLVRLQESAEPRLKGRTNAHLADWALELRGALRQANSDKAALRAWLEARPPDGD